MDSTNPADQELPGLEFRKVDTTEIGSISLVFAGASPAQLCGIYILRFEDEEAYVGQAVNVVNRYATHRRRWGDIVSLEFAVCPRELLDTYERRTVSAVEAQASLRNLMLTAMPGGWGDIQIDVESSEMPIELPWERERRATVASENPDSQLSRFWRLAVREDYAAIRSLLARYIHECIPDPVMTTHGMWTLTALPTTGRTSTWRRLLTLNCGRMETLFLGEEIGANGRRALVASLNLAADREAEVRAALPRGLLNQVDLEERTYRSSRAFGISGTGLSPLERLLEVPEVLDAAYRLNVTQMRQGSRLFAKYHNAPFALDVMRNVADLATRTTN